MLWFFQYFPTIIDQTTKWNKHLEKHVEVWLLCTHKSGMDIGGNPDIFLHNISTSQGQKIMWIDLKCEAHVGWIGHHMHEIYTGCLWETQKIYTLWYSLL